MANLKTHLTDAICSRARPETREYALRDERQRAPLLPVASRSDIPWL